MTAAGFDYKQYWNRRLTDAFGLESVGYIGLGKNFNRWMYAIRKASFQRIVRTLRIDFLNARVLDVGSGTGFYVAQWRNLGVEDITGLDISSQAVKNLRKQFPAHMFLEADITEDQLPSGQYDVISCMDVLFHIVDDNRFAAVINNLSVALNKGGRLIITDNFLRTREKRLLHHVSRPLRVYEDILAQSNLKIVTRKPVFFCLNYPLDSENKVLLFIWKWLLRIVPGNERLGNVLGMLLYGIDRIITPFLSEGPSTEIMVCERG